MIQKIRKLGNSLVVVIPKAANRMHKAQPGTLVEIVETPDGWHIRLVRVVPGLAPDIKALADDLADSRPEVFDALAD